MNITLKGKRYCVNGAGGKFARALVKELVHLGAKVLAVDTRMTSIVKQNLDDISTDVPGVQTRLLDVSDWAKTQEDLRSAGPFNGLVNTIGLIEVCDFLNVKEAQIDACIQTTLKAMVCLSQAVVQCMIDRNQPGVIINISSQSAKLGIKGHSVYSSTKGALDEFTKVMASDLEEYRIRVLSVNPTAVLTEIAFEAWREGDVKDDMIKMIPLNRFAEISEAVAAVVFCLSDECNIVNGSSIPVDGGFSAETFTSNFS